MTSPRGGPTMELGPTLTEFYSPSTSSERKQQLEQSLHAFRTMPNAHLTSLEIIVATGERREQQDLFVLYFCGCIVEGSMRRRWRSIPKEERLNVRKFLFEYLAASHQSFPRWVFTKLGKALVDVGKTSWPHEDPSFLPDLEQLASHPSTRVVGLDLLSLVCEEFVRPDSPLPNARKNELKASLLWAMPNILRVLAEVVAGSREAASGGHGVTDDAVRAAREAILGAARCLLIIVSWAPLTQHLTIELFRSLFGVIEAAAHGAGEGRGTGPVSTAAYCPSLQDCGSTCVACVTEVVSKRLLPPEQQDMVFGMADHMLALLKIVVSGGRIRAGLDEHFLLEMTEFLGAFMEANLGRVLWMGANNNSNIGDKRREPYPVAELLSLLASFTFAQPSTQGLQRCLRAWSAFVALATIEEGEGSPADVERSAALARDNAGGLQSVCRALLEKSLFVTNGDGLDELDDDADDGNSGGGNGSDGDDWEEDLHQGTGDGSSVSEREEFIIEVRGLLLSSSRVPGVGAALSENVLGAFSMVLEQLGSASSSSPQSAGETGGTGAAQQAQRLAADASTLCALMPVTAAAAATGDRDGGNMAGGGDGGGSGLILRAGHAVVEAAGAMATAGLHGRGPEFASLQGAALGAISALLPGLAGGAAAGTGDGGDVQATAIAEAVVALVRRCWESEVGVSGSAPVPAAAGRLLLALTSVLPPSALQGSPAIASLLTDASQVATALPVDARVLLYQSLSAFLLPPTLLTGDMARVSDLDGRARAYADLVAPLRRPLSAAVAEWQSWGGQPPWPGFTNAGVTGEVVSSCRVLCRLCEGLASTPAKARRVLYQALASALVPLVTLVPPTLEAAAAGSVKAAASMARALLRLQVAVVDSLGQEAGPTFASEAVTSLASSSGTSGGSMGGGPPWLSSAIFRLLTSVMRGRNTSTRALVPQACELALGRLDALGRVTAGVHQAGGGGWGERWLDGPIVEALPEFLDLAREILVTQWHCFVPSAANRGMGGVSIEDAFAARAQHAANKQQQQQRQSGGGGDGGDFASDVMASHFEGLMTVLRLLLSAPTTTSTKNGQIRVGGVVSGIDGGTMGDVGGSGGGRREGSAGEALEHHSVPPDLVRRGLLVLEAAHKGRRLFRFPPFASSWLPPMLTDALKGLTDGVHPLLKEEVGALVFDMAEVDHRVFATEFLPHFLATYYGWLGAAEREALLSPWRVGTHLDAPTFALSLEAFVSDLAFFRAQAEAA